MAAPASDSPDPTRDGNPSVVLTTPDGGRMQIFCAMPMVEGIAWEEFCMDLINYSTDTIEGTYGAVVPPRAIHPDVRRTLELLFPGKRMAIKIAIGTLTQHRIRDWAATGDLNARASTITKRYLRTHFLGTHVKYLMAVELRRWCDHTFYDMFIFATPPSVEGGQLVQAMAHIGEAVSAILADDVLGRHTFDLEPQNCMFDIDPKTRKASGYVSDLFAAEDRATTIAMGLGRARHNYKYLAPETVHAEYDRGAANVFAMALILNVALSRKQAYPGMAERDVTMGVRQGLRPALFRDVPSKVGGLSSEQERLLVKLLQDSWTSDPATRPTPRQFSERLVAVLRA